MANNAIESAEFEEYRVVTRIRLARYGSKKNPFYRLVVADHRFARDGRFLEIVGHYDPHKGTAHAVLKSDRIRYWLQQGAQPTNTARQILRKSLTS